MSGPASPTPGTADPTFLGWLANLRKEQGHPASRRLVLGVTGHLILSDEEEARATAHLIGHVLPGVIRQRLPGDKFTVISGAAPGSDQVFVRAAVPWLRNIGMDVRVVALLPVPLNWLHEDWLIRAEVEERPGLAQERREMEDILMASAAAADQRVPLYELSDQWQYADVRWRQNQYRRLAACLAERSDVLIAVLRAQKLMEPGGTAEVVEWRRQTARIPSRYSTLMTGEGRSPGQPHPLLVIDPGVAFEQGGSHVDSDPVSAVLAEASAALQHGNDLLSYDILQRAALRGLRNRHLEYLTVLSLASSGNTELALVRYRALNLAPEELSEDWLSLQGRLEKDLALEFGPDARRHFKASAQAYFSAYRRWSGYYSGINAASMFMLSGQRTSAHALAADVLRHVSGPPSCDEVDEYFRLATQAEASLLLGNVVRCRQSLQQADRLLPDDVSRRARTRGQLRRLCDELQVDRELLDTLRLPPVIFLRRLAGAAGSASAPGAINLPPEIRRCSMVFLRLTTPTDLALAEALQGQGALLYLTLPSPPADMRHQWLQRFGAPLSERLSQVLTRSERVSSFSGFLDSEDEWCEAQLDATALGISLITAQRFGTDWHCLPVQPQRGALQFEAPHDVPARRFSMERALATTGYAESALGKLRPAGRRMVGILFADFAGFRRISDDDLPRFWREHMGSIAELVARYKNTVLLRSTWGDALHVIASDAATIADLAIDIQACIDQRRRSQDGTLSDLELRLAAHYAPAFEGHDPVRDVPVFYGSQLSFTARIEPVAPPGTIFGSEGFVARLALEAPGRFAAAYAGEIELAKRFGRYRLFSLRRRCARGH